MDARGQAHANPETGTFFFQSEVNESTPNRQANLYTAVREQINPWTCLEDLVPSDDVIGVTSDLHRPIR